MTLASRAGTRIIARPALRKGRWRRLCYNAVVDAPVRSRHTVDHYLDHLAPLHLSSPGVPPASSPAGPVLQLPPDAIARAEQSLAAHGISANDEYFVVQSGQCAVGKILGARTLGGGSSRFASKHLGRPVACLPAGAATRSKTGTSPQLRAALSARGQSCVDLAGQLDLPTLVGRARARRPVPRGGFRSDAPRRRVAAAPNRPLRADQPLPLATAPSRVLRAASRAWRRPRAEIRRAQPGKPSWT